MTSCAGGREDDITQTMTSCGCPSWRRNCRRHLCCIFQTNGDGGTRHFLAALLLNCEPRGGGYAQRAMHAGMRRSAVTQLPPCGARNMQRARDEGGISTASGTLCRSAPMPNRPTKGTNTPNQRRRRSLVRSSSKATTVGDITPLSCYEGISSHSLWTHWF